MKKILVCGAGGFIGGAMLRRLKEEGYWVRGIDIKEHEFFNAYEVADEFVVGDLRDPNVCEQVVSDDIDEIYQFAADMGGAGFCFTGENDADILHNSASEFFILLLHVCTQSIIRWTLIIQSVLKTQRTQQTLIQNMGGKNCLVKDYGSRL